jgi:endonuclease YncB( thermonuclease family)
MNRLVRGVVFAIALCATARAAPTPLVIVIDGDTFRIGSERIRIMNIDAPETENRARCNAERRLAAVATERLTAIVRGQRLDIERHGKDRFGRTLAIVRVRGNDVGEMLIDARVAVRWGNGRPDWCAR